MQISDVFKSLVSGCVVYALVAACSSAGEPDKQAAGTDSGGSVGMNGNAGSDAMGTGAVAMAATGGDSAGMVCDCPATEPDVFIERDCGEKMVNTQPWAVLSVPGATADELTRITATYHMNDDGDVSGTPGAKSNQAALAFSDGVAYAQCFDIARFRVPADLAKLIE